jgi:hypothetical protein
MKGGIFNRPECCNQPCECPVCLENKPLMKLNCNHYVCLDDIQHIINSNPRRLQKCPICRVLITNYGCNGNITNVANNQQPNIIPYQEGETSGEETDDDIYVGPNVNANGYNIVSDDEGYETDELYGGKRKTNRSRKNSKRRKTNRSHKYSKKRKTNRSRKNKKNIKSAF